MNFTELQGNMIEKDGRGDEEKETPRKQKKRAGEAPQ